MTFAVLFIVSFIISTLTRTMRMQLKVNAMQAHRMELLLETSQQLQLAENMAQLGEEAVRQLYKLLNRTIIIYSVRNKTLQEPIIYHEHLNEEEEQKYLTENERAVAQWVLKKNRKAGVSTSTLPYAKALYYSCLLYTSGKEIKAMADDITAAVNEDGLYKAFLKYNLL